MVNPCSLKLLLRQQAKLLELRSPSRTAEEALERSIKQWTAYEQVNRDYCPDDPVYSIVNVGIALPTNADVITCKAPAAGQARVLDIIISAEGTASEFDQVIVWPVGTTLTGNTPITPEKFNSRAPAAQGTYGKNSTQAVGLNGNGLISIVYNDLGGFVRWLATPGEELYYINSEVLSFRAGITPVTGLMSITVIFEEL